MDSPSGTSLFSCGLFVAVAAMVAAAAVSFLPGLGAPQTVLPAPDRVALVVMVMSLAFSGVLLSNAVEFAGHNASDGRGFVCNSASLFRIRCTGGLVCCQWSEWSE